MPTADLMQQARIALREGQLPQARRLLRQVIHEYPENHAAWLLLAQATPDPRVAAQYRRRAELLRPDSPLVAEAQAAMAVTANQAAASRARRLAIAATALILLLAILGFGFGRGAWEQVNAERGAPVKEPIAALRQAPEGEVAAPQATAAQVTVGSAPATSIALFPVTAGDAIAVEATAVSTPDISGAQAAATIAANASPSVATSSTVPVLEDAALPEAIARGIVLESGTPAAEEIEEQTVDVEGPGGATVEEPLEVVEEALPAATEEESIKDAALATDEWDLGAMAGSAATGEKWIDVNLSTQTLVAYEGEIPVFNSLISSGLWDFPTVTGEFRTWLKYESQDMNGYLLGYDYYLPGVPYVMYFYQDYAIHGAYWHNNFGTPMSHGCVNVSPVDAGWLYNWAPLGTLVSVHY